MYCPKCGKEVGMSKFCPECGADMSENINNVHVKKKKPFTVKKFLKIFLGVVGGILVILVAVTIWGTANVPKYDPTAYESYLSLDVIQADSEKCQAIADYVANYLVENGYVRNGYEVEWIGYIKYRDLYSEEEYQEMALGGYYSYVGQTGKGEHVDGRVVCYWGDGEEPQIVNLSISSDVEKVELVEYSDEKIKDCWEVYNQKAFPSKYQ